MAKEEIKLDKNTNDMMERLKAIADRKSEIKEEETGLNKEKEYLQGLLVEYMRAEGLDKISAKGVGTASLKNKVIWTPKDWDKIYSYIEEHKEFGLLHKRLSRGLLETLEKNGIEVPGVGKMELPEVAFRRSNS